MRLRIDQLEAEPLIDAAGGGEYVVGPQDDLRVGRLAGERQAFGG